MQRRPNAERLLIQATRMPVMSLRPDLQQIVDEIDAAGRAAEALVAPLTDVQFHWQPALAQLPRWGRRSQSTETRAWSIAQCIDHLAVINVVYTEALAGGLEEARRRGLSGGGPITSTFFGRRFIASQEPPVRRKVRAPGKVVPRPSGSRDEIMQAYRGSHETIRAIVRRCSDVDINRATFPNPFLPLVRVRVGTGLRILTAHERRHLWQAEQVRTAADFPR